MPPKKKEADSKPKKEDSGESQLHAQIAAAARQNADLEVQIAFLREKLLKTNEECSFHQRDAECVKASLASTKQDYIDILEHQGAQLRENESTTAALRKRVEDLETASEKKDHHIAELEEQNRKNGETLRECDSVLEDKQRLEQLVKSQQAMMEKQSKEIDRWIQKHDACVKEKETGLETISNLELMVKDRTELRILFEDASLVTTENRWTKGEPPSDALFNRLVYTPGALDLYKACSDMSLGDKVILLSGEGPFQMGVFDIASMEWSHHCFQDLPFSRRYGQSMCSFSRSKIIMYGGYRDGELCSDVEIINTESLNWQSMDLPPMVSPKPRHKHASCFSRERLFIFGGVVEEALSNELWILDTECLEWKHVLGYGEEPSPREDAAMGVSEDGRRLYLFGGWDGEHAVNDLYSLDIEKQVWSTLTTSGRSPEPRLRHTTSVLMHYFVIGGGVTESADGTGCKNLGDVHVLDLSTSTWETIDDGAWTADYPWMKPEAQYLTSMGSKAIALKPDRDGKLSQVGIVKFLLPGEISTMRAAKKKETRVCPTLEIVTMTASANSIEVHWRPPTKNVDRIDRYKLMIAEHTGSVSSCYEGKDQSYRVTRLRQNSEYILCVKAVYDDGSFVWSDSKACRTRCIH